jgi:hypothetical protein
MDAKEDVHDHQESEIEQVLSTRRQNTQFFLINVLKSLIKAQVPSLLPSCLSHCRLVQQQTVSFANARNKAVSQMRVSLQRGDQHRAILCHLFLTANAFRKCRSSQILRNTSGISIPKSNLDNMLDSLFLSHIACQAITELRILAEVVIKAIGRKFLTDSGSPFL